MACKKVRNMENIIKVSMFESAQNRYASGVVNLCPVEVLPVEEVAAGEGLVHEDVVRPL